MLHHQRTAPAPPKRVVVLGAKGFIGSAVTELLKRTGVSTVSLGRADLDLLHSNASNRLAALLNPADALVMTSARAPCKAPAMMVDNIQMIGSVCEALTRTSVEHVVYISSDAVYADSSFPLTELSPTAPTSLHGAMHLAREHMLSAVVRNLAILRPTLVYGAKDPHNGYGPNRFRRQANLGEPIILFGQGEERRDHVLVDDIAELVSLVLAHRSSGVLNVATGMVNSFREIAEQVIALSPHKVAITGNQRSGPMPHNGYRPFDVSSTFAAFPGFVYTSLAEGLARAQQQEFA